MWAATVGEKVLGSMAALMDALLELHLLDDDDRDGARLIVKTTLMDQATVTDEPRRFFDFADQHPTPTRRR